MYFEGFKPVTMLTMWPRPGGNGWVEGPKGREWGTSVNSVNNIKTITGIQKL